MSDDTDNAFTEGWVRGQSAAFNEALQMMREELYECERLGLDAETPALARVMGKLAFLADERFAAMDSGEETA